MAKLYSLAIALVAANDVDALAELLGKHPQLVQLVGYRGNTLLHQAVARGKHELLDLLIQVGVPVNAKNDVGRTALDIAKSIGDSTALDILIDSGGRGGSDFLPDAVWPRA